jgi:hypothetical protein
MIMKKAALLFIVLLTGLAVLDCMDGDIVGVVINGGLGFAWVVFYPKLKRG